MVDEPPQPRKVKLRMPARSPEPPKLKLRFGGQKSSGSVGVSIDNEALKRQQEVVRSGSNPREAPVRGDTPQFGARNPFGRSPSSSGTAQIPSLHPGSLLGTRGVSVEHSVGGPNGVKNEVPFGQLPAAGAVILNRENNSSNESTRSPLPAASTMPPPPGTMPRLASYSPHLSSATSNGPGWNAQPSGSAHDSRGKQPIRGKHDRGSSSHCILIFLDAADALITNLSISTHPSLRLDQHFHLDIPPSPTSQRSITINLPKTQHYLRIVPTLASSVKHRPSKLCVTAGMQRLEAAPQRAEEYDAAKPIYEVRLMEGVNRVEIEMVAGPPRGAPKNGSGQGIDKEKFSAFINVAKN